MARKWFWNDRNAVAEIPDFSSYGANTASALGTAVRACVDRIQSRGAGVKFKGGENIRPNTPAGKWAAPDFYSKIIEDLCINGWSVAYRKFDGTYEVAVPEGSTLNEVDGSWHLSLSRAQNGEMKHVKKQDVVFFTYYPQRGRDYYIPESPIVGLSSARLMQEKARNLLIDYASRGHKLGFVLQGMKEVTSQKVQENLLKTIAGRLKAGVRSYDTIYSPMEVQVQNSPTVHKPTTDPYQISIQEIGMLYGVPLPLLNSPEPGGTTDHDRLESSLLLNGVYPVLQRIAIGWSQHLKQGVEFDVMSVTKPTIGARAKHAMGLAQTGCYTVNEIRKMSGYDPIEGGDVFPEVAGAPSTGDASKTEDAAV